eukprot:TRINITY_DN627_c0_g1_i12.p1 TRINITY_DN627_c0_g1~~TRINITY_DN627_c0_g1_i12.p1  ORF type:complete len:109 (+),score=14.97 TRINITY_DN627_c0_g1_i12:77-403(+)
MILHEDEEESETPWLYDARKLMELASKGAQPSVKLLARLQKILTVRGALNQTQYEFLMCFLYRSLYKGLIPADLAARFNLKSAPSVPAEVSAQKSDLLVHLSMSADTN